MNLKTSPFAIQDKKLRDLDLAKEYPRGFSPLRQGFQMYPCPTDSTTSYLKSSYNYDLKNSPIQIRQYSPNYLILDSTWTRFLDI